MLENNDHLLDLGLVGQLPANIVRVLLLYIKEVVKKLIYATIQFQIKLKLHRLWS